MTQGPPGPVARASSGEAAPDLLAYKSAYARPPARQEGDSRACAPMPEPDFPVRARTARAGASQGGAELTAWQRAASWSEVCRPSARAQASDQRSEPTDSAGGVAGWDSSGDSRG
eukprot:185658-Prymnesium_polylepis.1